MVLSNMKVTVLAAALAAFGAVASSTESSPFIAVMATVGGLIMVLVLAFKLRSEESAAHQLTLPSPATSKANAASKASAIARIETVVRTTAGGQAIAVGMIVASLPLASFLYAQHLKEPAANDLSRFSGSDVIFIATTSTEDLCKTSRELILNCDSLLFPRTQKLTGKTLLVLPQHSDTLKNLCSQVSQKHPLLQLRIQGHVCVPRKQVPVWDYDKRKRLALQGIFSTCSADSIACAPGQISAERSEIRRQYDAAMSAARELMVSTHRRYLPPQLADLLSSMVLGNRAVALPPEITHKFRDVGLSHILAASGFNLTIVTVMSYALCRIFTPSAVACNTFCFLSILGFVSLAGPSPSVNRAAMMCSIMLIAKSGQRRCNVLAALALSFLLTLCFDPLCTNDLGLQLSYAATLGIVLGSKALASHLYSGKTKWKKSLADAISVVLIAQLSVMPIQLFYFWRAGTMFIPANLLVTPLITPLTMLGFASSTLALMNVFQTQLQTGISLVIAFADAIAFIPLTAMVLLVNGLGSLEGANFSIGPPSAFGVTCYYTCFLGLLIALRLKSRIKPAWTAFICALITLLWRPSAPFLTIASVHGHTIVINNQQQAIELNCAGHAQPSKLAERFAAYSGAKFAQESFKTGTLRTGIPFVHSEKWLLLLVSSTANFARRSNAMEILSTARKLQCNRIVIIARRDRLPSAEFLPPCEYKPLVQTEKEQPKFVELKNMGALQFVRK